MPPSMADWMSRTLSASVMDWKPRCHPPSPMAETRSPVRPSIVLLIWRWCSSLPSAGEIRAIHDMPLLELVLPSVRKS